MNLKLPHWLTTDSPYHPENNEMRDWEKDTQGRWVLVGLTYPETIDFLDLSERKPPCWHSNARHDMLLNRHTKARITRIMKEIEVRDHYDASKAHTLNN